jgi:hypothetical protein
MRRRPRQTHHKHSSKKDYRRLLDKLAAHEAVHSVATGRVKPRMGAGRPVAAISKLRVIESGLAITINSAGAIVDAFVVTSEPELVAAWLRDEGLAR